ncbi:MAG TPA: hypothetical protein VM367_18075 [Pseudonocardia sp.]|nr:hypothetical protein [Pseudonocardia sp.]
MRATVSPRVLVAAVAVLLTMFSAGCGARAAGGVAVPTFSTPEPSSTPGVPAPEERLPGDCGRLLGVEDVEALLGLPLGTAGVRTVVGVPAPSVGRTERVSCRYTMSGVAPGFARGARLIDLDTGVYVDGDAAARHWRTNTGVEDGAAREITIGTASGILVERPAEAVLFVVSGPSTVTVTLPSAVRVGERAAADTLVDLALRVLPRVTPGTSPLPTGAAAPAQ